MGLFDYVRCEYPLPGNPPMAPTRFQTKDLACIMTCYTITNKGHLVNEDGLDDRTDFTGTIRLAWSNVVAVGPGVYTADGEDAVSLEYQAVFVHGRLDELKEVSVQTEPAAKSQPLTKRALTPEQTKEMELRRAESLVGRTMYLWWGGKDECYPVKVVAENSLFWVAERPDKCFEIIRRMDRDRILFDSRNDGVLYLEKRKADWETKREEFEAEIRSKLTP